MDGTEIREREESGVAAEQAAPTPEPSMTATEQTATAVVDQPAAATAEGGDVAPVEVVPGPEAEPASTVANGAASNGSGAPAEAAAGADDEMDFAAMLGGEFGDGASLMEQFLSEPDHDYKSLKYGDVMDGIIMHVDREELLVDIGSKSEGIIPAREYSDLTPEEKQALQIGDTILVFVVQPENPEGHPVVSINRARQEKSWRRLQEIHEANQVIEAEVTNYNKGGLLVNLDGVRGFVPASQVSEIRGGDEASKQADMARLIGTTLPLKVIEINRHRNRLILSERQAIQERRDVMKERLIAELKEGEVRQGKVSSICDFGAFVDIGGADGLVHLSELSWSRVRHPSEVLKVGQEVEVYVLGINAQEKKIALSIKRTQAEPWSRVAANYEVGQLVRGTVTQLANFGAFARIEDGIEGLIHVSELADERISHPKQAVQEGQDLLLRIIRIDPQRRRMGLSLRRALDTPDADLIAVFGENAVAERDQLAQQIRSALEAEGIEIGSFARRSDDETARTAVDPSSLDAIVALQEAPIQQVATTSPGAGMANFQLPTERPQPRAKPRRESNRPQPDLPGGIEGDEEMSAMALAFAMAGANADLVEAAVDDDATKAAPAAEELAAEITEDDAPATPAAAEAAAPVEAAAPEAAAPEAAAPVEDAAPVEATVPTEAGGADETGEGGETVG